MFASASDIATALATVDHRAHTGGLYQTVKALHSRGLVRHADTAGAKGAYRFAEVEAAIAVILATALDSGFAGGELAQITSFLRENTARLLEPYWALEIVRFYDPYGAQTLAFEWVIHSHQGDLIRRGARAPDLSGVISLTHLPASARVQAVLSAMQGAR
jgi:hypothetical protein